MDTGSPVSTAKPSEKDTPEGFIPSPHYFITVSDDDESQVLELVKVDGEHYFIRDHKQWLEIDPDADNDRVWDRVIHDVDEDAAEAYDIGEDDGSITVDLFVDSIIEDTP